MIKLETANLRYVQHTARPPVLAHKEKATRERVICLSLDVKGYVGMARNIFRETTSIEAATMELAEFNRDYLAFSSALISLNGGKLISVEGDGLFVAWKCGGEGSFSNAVKNAAKTAMQIQRMLKNLRLESRAGISEGFVSLKSKEASLSSNAFARAVHFQESMKQHYQHGSLGIQKELAKYLREEEFSMTRLEDDSVPYVVCSPLVKFPVDISLFPENTKIQQYNGICMMTGMPDLYGNISDGEAQKLHSMFLKTIREIAGNSVYVEATSKLGALVVFNEFEPNEALRCAQILSDRFPHATTGIASAPIVEYGDRHVASFGILYASRLQAAAGKGGTLIERGVFSDEAAKGLRIISDLTSYDVRAGDHFMEIFAYTVLNESYVN